MSAIAGPQRRLCARADQDGMHWLAPGEKCFRLHDEAERVAEALAWPHGVRVRKEPVKPDNS
jgi:hypothetical protein